MFRRVCVFVDVSWAHRTYYSVQNQLNATSDWQTFSIGYMGKAHGGATSSWNCRGFVFNTLSFNWFLYCFVLLSWIVWTVIYCYHQRLLEHTHRLSIKPMTYVRKTRTKNSYEKLVRVNSREKIVRVSYRLAARYSVYFSCKFLALNRPCFISCKFLVRVFGASFSYEFLVHLSWAYIQGGSKK